jgi:hypothetical protein
MADRIGILGSGSVGQALAMGFSVIGYDVMVGTRTPSKLEDWKVQTAFKGTIGTFEKASAFGEKLVLAVKGTVAVDVLSALDDNGLKGKLIMDATNPIASEPPENGVLKFFSTMDRSFMEELQLRFPETHFVKVFNSVGAHLMYKPDFKGQKPTMFICGDHAESKMWVEGILDQFGWEPEDMGSVQAARAIEPLCMLWCIPGFNENKWAHAFKLLKQ